MTTNYLNVKFTINNETIEKSLDVSDLKINVQSNGMTTGYGFIPITHNNKTYAHVKLWSYYKDPSLMWHEVLITNSSIENGVGYYTADYAIELNPPVGVSYKFNRTGAQFFDGTGYLELGGLPVYAPLPGAESFYTRYIDLADANVNQALLKKNYTPTLESYAWDALDWSVAQFDSAKDTHTTGSPRNVGSAWMPGVAAIAFNNNAQKLKDITGYIFGWIGQQSRRPLHFFHDTGIPFTASEYPSLVMSEHGPSTLWSAKELWSRNTWTAEQKKKGKWVAWDHEHLTVDQLVIGYILYGSMFCLTQIKLILEAVLTHPHLKAVKTSMSQRVWGWNLRALAWGIFVMPNEIDVISLKNAANVLIQSYLTSAKYSPIPSIFPQPADGRHLYPTAEEMLSWYPLNNLELPIASEYVTKLEAYQANPNPDTDRALAKYLVDYLYPNYGYTELNKCLTTWSFVTPFQLAVMASGLSLYNDIHELGSSQAATIAQHLVLCLYTKARNPNGTFWYDYGAVLPNHVVGDGTNMVGTTVWVAGGLAMLIQFIPILYHKMIGDSIKTVYNSNNKESLPSHDAFYSWLPQAFHNLGYPEPKKTGGL